MKYLDFLASTSEGKLTVTHILTKPPTIWRGLTGHLDDNILFNWISKYYQVPPPAIPPRINTSTVQTVSNFQSQIPPQIPSQNPSQVTVTSSQMLLSTAYNPPPINEPFYSPSPPPMNTPSFMYNSNNEMNVLSERQEFMRMLSQDATQAYKVVVCGPPGMMDSVRRSLERIGFPVDSKALFIN
jgi:hypothetical protein